MAGPIDPVRIFMTEPSHMAACFSYHRRPYGSILLIIITLHGWVLQAQVSPPSMVRIPAGRFRMGSDKPLPDSILPGDRYSTLSYLKQGDADELPVHSVLIGSGFEISATEVTADAFRLFDPAYRPTVGSVYATGVSWHDAVEYCRWLSRMTGKTYRLPTEAEWEYVTLLQEKNPALGVRNLKSGPAEWCLDWYGPYLEGSEKDPVGPSTGLTKVIRGGGLDRNSAFFLRSTNRASMPPSFPPERHHASTDRLAALSPAVMMNRGEDTAGRLGKEQLYQNFVRQSRNNQGNHEIGFRVVHSDAVLRQRRGEAVFPLSGVKLRQPEQRQGSDRPWYRIREVLPTPMDDSPDSVLTFLPVLGLPAGLLSHNHSPAMEVMPNGDVLMVIYTSVSETTHDVKLMVSRLRFGARSWDPPAIMVDCADANDHAPLLWQDADTTWLFWGNNKYEASFPFQWTRSFDFGQTWEEVRYPVFRTPVLEHSAQPITSAFRDAAGTIYIGSDGVGSASVLWRSEDNGRTWVDPGGRTQGRHSAFLPLKDGRILAIGGKNSHFEGAMPKFLSSDGGASWTVERTPFMPLGSGQRPSAIRLRSGRILVSGDLDSRMGKLPDSLVRLPRNRGCYLAYSDDEGAHWSFKMLPGSQLGNTDDKDRQFRTLGYSVMRQGPNGNIHLLATVVHPVLHYEFNEAWLSDPDTLMSNWPSASSPMISVRRIRETYADGSPKHVYGLAGTTDGKYWLHGTESWFDARGNAIYTATYRLGEKTGTEIFQPSGKLLWKTSHGLDGYERKTYDWKGAVRSVSRWKGTYADGEAVQYDGDGRPLRRLSFEHGELKGVIGLR